MKQIGPSFSHVNLVRREAGKELKEWSKPTLIEDILKSEPYAVASYDELVRNVAQIHHRNRNFTLFYRGQSADHREDGKTIIVPSIYRKKEGKSKLQLKENFKKLEHFSDALKAKLNTQEKKLAGTLMLNKYPEIAWSVLQHYGVCATPLLDLSHSLHVACSFAFDGNSGKTGVIYVLGMPFATDALGYNSYEELVNIRLLSVCPPQAQRPFFQEGFLAGAFPNYKLDEPARVNQFDFGRRLVAKFEIPINDDFWGAGFTQIPNQKLYPPDDKMLDITLQIKGGDA